MSDWVETHDPDTQRIYWYHRRTRETTWQEPSRASSSTPSAASGGTASGRDRREDDDDNGDDAANWKESVDTGTGKKYYFHRKTKETRWDRPAVLGVDAKAEAPAVDAAEAPATISFGEIRHWRKFTDKISGKVYYYNKRTKQTSWKEPPGFVDKESASKSATISADKSATISAAKSTTISAAKSANVPSSMVSSVTPDVIVSRNDPEEDTTNRSMPLAVKYASNFAATKESIKESVTLNNRSEPLMSRQDSTSSVHRPTPGRSGASKSASPDTRTDESVDEPVSMKKLLQDSDDDSDSVGDSRRFQFAKHRHGWLNRTLRIGKVYNEEMLLSYKKSMIKKALLKQNRALDDVCCQFFRNVMSYMGDRKSSKPDIMHARKVLMEGLAAPESVKDEVYLQICKQLTNHPRTENCLKGWELMMLVLGTFPPSRSLSNFLTEYFERTAASQAHDRAVVQLARSCMTRLDRIVSLGPRLEVPSDAEIKAVQMGKDVPVRVALLNDDFRTLFADSFLQIGDAKQQVATQLDLKYTVPFALYQIRTDTGEETIVEDEVRVLDVVASWGTVGPQHQFQLCYKAELVLRSTERLLSADPQALHLLYIQAVHDVVTDRYPAEKKDLASMAALQLQASFGDYQASLHNHRWVVDKLDSLVPNSILDVRRNKDAEQKSLELAQRIISKYCKLQGIAHEAAKNSYLDFAQEWPLYGATFFVVEQKQLKEYPSSVAIAITSEAVLLLDAETKAVLETFKYQEVVTWGYSDEKFILVIGNLVQQRKLFFRTVQGKFLNKIIGDYVQVKTENIRAQQKPEQGRRQA